MLYAKAAFAKLNAKREAEGLPGLLIPGDAAAGSLRQLRSESNLAT